MGLSGPRAVFRSRSFAQSSHNFHRRINLFFSLTGFQANTVQPKWNAGVLPNVSVCAQLDTQAHRQLATLFCKKITRPWSIALLWKNESLLHFLLPTANNYPVFHSLCGCRLHMQCQPALHMTFYTDGPSKSNNKHFQTTTMVCDSAVSFLLKIDSSDYFAVASSINQYISTDLQYELDSLTKLLNTNVLPFEHQTGHCEWFNALRLWIPSFGVDERCRTHCWYSVCC